MSVICTIFAALEYDPLEYDAGRGGDEVAFLSVRRKFPLLELGAHFFGYIPRLPRGGAFRFPDRCHAPGFLSSRSSCSPRGSRPRSRTNTTTRSARPSPAFASWELRRSSWRRIRWRGKPTTV